MSRRRPLALAAALAAVLLSTALPVAASADVDPPGCTPDLQYDPTIPTFDQVTGTPLSGTGLTGSTSRHLSADIYQYFDAVKAATDANDRVRMLVKDLGTSVRGKPLKFYVIGTKANIENLDAGRKDGAFWAGVRDGTVSEAEGLAAVRSRPALVWATATPHGTEPAASEALSRQLYELAARVDCANQIRLGKLDVFLMPVRNPDGRDALVRGSAWGFDHNRDFGTRQQVENRSFIPVMNQYPGLFFIDAHQQPNGYFFPPNADPVHHEVSSFTFNTIQNDIGPALQSVFNDQSGEYSNYTVYDLFVPEYGDSVPSMIMGAAGMTFEKGTSESYGKQLYDHYLAIDQTINVTARNKERMLGDWTRQWQEAVDQGETCSLQPNRLVVPATILEPVSGNVCGYFFPPGDHASDVAALITELQEVGVKVYTLDTAVNAAGVRRFGGADETATLPAGTSYVPMAQPQKHWIQAILGEEPFAAAPYFYDVATWSYPLLRGLGGAGYLTQQLPVGVGMTPLGAPAFGTVTEPSKPVQAFNTDSVQGLALVAELLDKGVTVYRAGTGFDAAGARFHSGAALVPLTSLTSAGVDIAPLAAARQTPVRGLDTYPVDRFLMAKPKIGLYTGTSSVPANPLYDAAGAPAAEPGHCASLNAFCEALFVLTQKHGLPASMIAPVTTTALAGGSLVGGAFTAFVNPNAGTVAAGAGATALQAFVNGGGVYIGTLAGGITSARNAGLTLTNTVALSPSLGPSAGTTFDGTYTTTDAAAWGFDRGGWVYRTATSNPVINPATLAGNGGSIPAATAAVSYAPTPLRDYGSSTDSTGAGRLDGRPVVVDQPFGTGRAVLFSTSPFFRAWKDGDERLVLNAILYPRGAALTPDARLAGEPAPPAGEAESVTRAEALAPVAAAVPAAKLPAVAARPVRKDGSADDVRITVSRKALPKLRSAVKAARLSKRLRARSAYVVTRTRATFVVRGARRIDQHERTHLFGPIAARLLRQKVKLVSAAL